LCINVIKRNGNREPLDLANIRKQTEPACEGLNASFETLELEASISFKDRITTSEIADILEFTALKKVDVDAPDWVFVAGRLKLYKIYHEIKHHYKKKKHGDVYTLVSFKDYLDKNKDILSFDYNTLDIDIEKLNSYIEPERDKLLTAHAVDTLASRYLIKNKEVHTELPQHFFMCLALFLAQKENDVEYWTKKFYDAMSLLEAEPATPTLANGRIKDGNCFSCATGSTEDNIGSIFDTYKTQAFGSKSGTGWGWDWTRVRANGSTIKNVKGASGGIVPWLKLENDVALAVDQLGVRLGAINCSLESWHLDIEDFIDLKKDGGEDRRRAKELFITVSCSDEFMRRIESEEDWTLFDPYDARKLTELYGKEFEKEYKRLEQAFESEPEQFSNTPKKINAKKLWKKIQRSAVETGMPFIFFKDNVNNSMDLQNVKGLVRSANLCMEYMTPIENNEVVLCNLGSINLSKINPDNKNKMKEVIYTMHRMLDNVIDLTSYPIPNSEKTQKERRSVGLGVAGEAELIASKQILYGSKEHKEYIEELYSLFEQYSDEASIELAKERGAWHKDSIHRNYVRRCIAPTTSVSVIMGTSASFEAVFDKVWIEENKLGTYAITAPNVNLNNYNYYVPAYKVSIKDSIELTAIRQKRIDMGISNNIYIDPTKTKGKEIFDGYMLAWKLGMKTIYYCRGLSLREPACFNCAG